MRFALKRVALGGLATVAAVALLTACASSQAGSGTAAAQVNAGAPAAPPGGSAAAPATPAAPSSVPRPVTPVAVNHCAGNAASQLVKVSLRDQHMWMCHYATVAYQTAITSGASSLPYDSTPTGNFQVQGRDRDTVLTLNTGKQYNVQYWIPFSAPLFGFHDASWQAFPYGSPLYKTQGSHGCVHMPLQAIAFFYHWVHVGTAVQIRA